MANVAAAHPGFPADVWDALEDPDGGRYEIIRGALALAPSPTPDHQDLMLNICVHLRRHCPPGYRASLDVDWRIPAGESTYVAAVPRPDVVVWPAQHDRVTDPVLAVEVLSPSDHQRLKGSILTRAEGKRLDYAAGGLSALLEIDADASTMTVYRLTGGVLVQVATGPSADLIIGGTTITIDLGDLGKVTG